jgi:hypothetical protein
LDFIVEDGLDTRCHIGEADACHGSSRLKIIVVMDATACATRAPGYVESVMDTPIARLETNSSTCQRRLALEAEWIYVDDMHCDESR